MDHTQNETDTGFFTCLATGGPVPTISWYFNDVPVDVTNTMKYDLISPFPGLSLLRINNVQSSDVGTYTCNATNVVSSDISSGVLTVNGEDYVIVYNTGVLIKPAILCKFGVIDLHHRFCIVN